MNRSLSAGVAGLCFLGCGLIVALACLFATFRTYGPIWREVIHATVTPQFAAGMFSGIGLVVLCALIFAYGERR